MSLLIFTPTCSVYGRFPQKECFISCCYWLQYIWHYGQIRGDGKELWNIADGTLLVAGTADIARYSVIKNKLTVPYLI